LDLVWPLVELAEYQRLLRTHGYAKDNAIPPPLGFRLRDARFGADLEAALGDLELAGPDRRRIADLLQKLTEAAHRDAGE
jgi:hypothetical protein